MIYREYVETIRMAVQHRVPVNDIMDYTIAFCEERDLCEEFVACNMNPVKFFALAKYRMLKEATHDR